MKTFRELKEGDKIYVINEGTDVGYLRIEEYILEEALHPSNKVVGTYIAKQKDCSWDLIIHESLLDKSNCGFIFTTLEKAMELYIKKSEELVDKLFKKYVQRSEEAKKVYMIYETIAINAEYARMNCFDKIKISKQYKEDEDNR